ncbi:hypothetical protein F4561_005737 [Lipingzhangella halophila]|uniref:Class I SAM-dependent methyltransferase n=1 Tax=Lipingzhangella halophila TaxID=1783352 RepID=A0A7W7RLZ0_9ACTN|nr:class I SAM-dependent methyltransferase [Lipingzhangella halophila]MBB4934429.1 hypothetical protein [Lipingzhangella halophila]MBB4934843.1 hypothetical protein [Lipingzhangella halophila]
MSSPRTVLDAALYWDTYYADVFRFGQGTEHILALLGRTPPVHTWSDLGSGSESLLWSIALNARRLTSVDTDPDRLATLTAFARTGRPRGIHTVALALCGRDADAFPQHCRCLTSTLVADCLTPERLPLRVLSADLLTQFGLLGLCRNTGHFTDAFTRLHAHLPEHGWAAGANWVPADSTGRVHLTHGAYQHAARQANLHLLQLDRLPSTDPDFPHIWTYLARRIPR